MTEINDFTKRVIRRTQLENAEAKEEINMTENKIETTNTEHPNHFPEQCVGCEKLAEIAVEMIQKVYPIKSDGRLGDPTITDMGSQEFCRKCWEENFKERVQAW